MNNADDDDIVPLPKSDIPKVNGAGQSQIVIIKITENGPNVNIETLFEPQANKETKPGPALNAWTVMMAAMNQKYGNKQSSDPTPGRIIRPP